jgi:hypothetical protein
VVDGDEEVTHVYPITCVELLSRGMLISLKKGKIRILWTPDHMNDLRWRVESDENQS